MNKEISKILYEMAILLEMKGVEFKPRAYEKVADVIESLAEDVGDIYKHGGIKALEDIPGVGQSIAEKIEEYIKTKHVKEYDKLKKEIPVDIEGLASIEGVGPKTILRLYKKLGIKTRDQLEKSATAGELVKSGFGKKTEENILKSIGFLKKEHGRYLLGDIMPVAEKTPEIKSIHSQGEHRALVRLNIDTDADMSVVSPESLGSALIAWTGDKQHNIALRTLAEKKS